MSMKDSSFKKVIFIIVIVFICGLIFQVSRTQFVLKSQANKQLIEQKDDILAGAVNLSNYKQSSGNSYCILYKGKDKHGIKIKNNTKKSLEYMKKKTQEINIEEEKVNLDKCDVTLLTTNHIGDIGKIEKIENYVFNGGYIFAMTTLEIDTNYQIIYRKLGISSFSEYIDTKGIQLISNVLIGEKGLEIDDEFVSNFSIGVRLNDEAETLIKSMDETPLLWKSKYGKGAFMVFNGTILEEKINRGLLVGSLSLLEPYFIYSVFNEKLFYIDDFPAPVPKGNNSVIYKEYQRDIATFFNEIWWPNMLKIAEKYDLKYTGGVIESYGDKVTPPFNNTEDKDRHYLIEYGREILKSGGEIGFHGYNHQSLTIDQNVSDIFDYNAWRNVDEMSESIKELLEYAENAFPKYKVSAYIPPSNVFSQEGREALKAVWPNLTVISSLYEEDIVGRAYVQEFEIANDGIIEMPRITSGYFERDFDRWAEANTMTGLGFFSHFVHPDDVISTDRSNNLGWKEMYKDYEKYMSRVNRTYPWLRSMTSTEGALTLAKTLQSQVTWKNSEDSIEGTITNYAPNLYYILRSDKKIKRLHDCELQKIDTNTYLIEAKDEKFKIELGES